MKVARGSVGAYALVAAIIVASTACILAAVAPWCAWCLGWPQHPLIRLGAALIGGYVLFHLVLRLTQRVVIRVLARCVVALAVAATPTLASAGDPPAADDAQRRAVVELLQLAGVTTSLEHRLDAFEKDMAAKLPKDTPADALSEVVRRIRVAFRPDAVLCDVAADAATRFTPEQVDAAATQLRGGSSAADVVGLIDARLARATDRELARASAQVLGEVNVEIEKSSDETEANLAKWKQDIAALRHRADALAPAEKRPEAKP